MELTTVISASSHTCEALPALLRDKHPDVFGVNGYGYAPKTIADHLSEAGYQTGGFHSNPYVPRAHGFNSGFDTFDDDLVSGRNRFIALAQHALDKFALNKGDYHVRAEELSRRSLSWFETIDEAVFR